MNLHRRQFLDLAVGAAALPMMPRPVRALDYPTRPIHLLISVPPGGGADILARLVGQSLSQRLGQPIVVEYRPGAGGNLAAEAVVQASPDGYTLLMASTANTTNVTLYPHLDFNFIRDIAPVGTLVRTAFAMVVSASFPAKTVPEFIAYAKANPGTINMASSGIGNTNHIFGELFKMMTGIEMTHIPYHGGAPSILAVVAGQVQVFFSPLPEPLEQIKAGKLRALGVTTATRVAVLPDVPSIGEFVKGYEASGWQGIGAPRDTPPEIIDKLNREINAMLADPGFQARFSDLGIAVFPSSPAEFANLVVAETDKWAKVIRAANIKAE